MKNDATLERDYAPHVKPDLRRTHDPPAPFRPPNTPGAKLGAVRRALELDHDAMARKLGVSTGRLIRLETGAASLAPAELNNLEHCIGISMEWFFHGGESCGMKS